MCVPKPEKGFWLSVGKLVPVLFTPSCQLLLIVPPVTDEEINLQARLAGKHCYVVTLPTMAPPTGPTWAVFGGVPKAQRKLRLPFVFKVP